MSASCPDIAVLIPQPNSLNELPEMHLEISRKPDCQINNGFLTGQ